MPVWHNKETDKWCYGSRCVYDTEADAKKVEAAVHAQEAQKKVEDAEVEVFGKVLEVIEVKVLPKGVEVKVGEVSKIIPILKFDEAKRLVYGVVYEPDTVDAQGDFAEAAEIEKACHLFMEHYQQVGKMHEDMLDKSSVCIVECYINPIDAIIGNDRVRKGSWVMVTKIYDEGIWKQVKSGELGGYSMAGICGAPPDGLADQFNRFDARNQAEDELNDWLDSQVDKVRKSAEAVSKLFPSAV